jgi:hypothetical protein|tara:strand:- start:1146 stop:1754 length:609 start_codon:yes stop_codon:yes gene_type:complete
MEHINSNYHHKNTIIGYILNSNKDSDNIFYQERNILSQWIMRLEKDEFFNSLVLLNYNSFIGYFSLYEKKQIEKSILINNFDQFKEIISNYNITNLQEESMAHNLWLARLILGNDKYEWKYLIEARKRFIKDKNIINFKNKVKLNNKVYDLNIVLQSIVNNKNNFSISDREWLLDKYKKEIKLIKFYLEEELTSEITDKSIS